jgi:hypothetical protein
MLCDKKFYPEKIVTRLVPGISRFYGLYLY